MELTSRDILKKTILDTQERVRDFMNYADHCDNHELSQYFRDYAEMEGQEAHKMRVFLDGMQRH